MSVVGQVRDGMASGLGAVRRITFAAMLLRGVVWATGMVALVLALPTRSSWSPGVTATVWLGIVVVLLAAVPALLPGRWPVLALELVAVGGWLLRTTADGPGVGFLPLVLLAAALYVHHTAGALAAAVPLDVRVLPGVLRRWLARTGVVLAVTAFLAAVALPLSDQVGDAGTVGVPVLGVLMAVLAAGLLAYGLHRDDGSDGSSGSDGPRRGES